MISSKEFKSPLKFPASGYETVTCHYPLRLDVYSGCEHDCTYCYAGLMLRARGMWDPQQIRMADVNQIEKEFEIAFSGKGWSPISKAIRHKLPVRLGGMTDCFQRCEQESGTALKLLQLLNKHDYPYMIVTKGDVIAQDEYLDELEKGKSYVQVTVISLDDKAIAKVEPGAPLVADRFKAIKSMASRGIYVCGRLSPVIPTLSTRRIEEYVQKMADAGAKHILAEFFRGPRTMIQKIEEMTSTPFMDVMERKGTYYRANVNYKNDFYSKLKVLCLENGLGFTVCSDGDLVPQDFNTTENCCGTDPIPGFENCSTCTANALAREVQDKGEVTLDEMKTKYWSPDQTGFDKMWESGRLAELVSGVEKNGSSYKGKK